MGRRLGHATVIALATACFVASLAISGAAFAADNTSCLSCHGPAMSMPVADVDRDSACASCHLPGFVGAHPYHQQGANCGAACHPGWGDSLLTAVPSFADPVSGAAFSSPGSKATAPAILHIIHSTPRWPAGVDTSSSRCASCHEAAACNACHTGAVSTKHANHSSAGNESYPAYPA